MRKAFVETLTNIAREDPRAVVVTPDMGFSIFEGFCEEFPDRLYNTGIAEQNSVGVAAGLAMRGKIVYVYSIVPFVTMRPFEQVRIDACYQNLPIKLVGSGGGLTYGYLGPTHHSTEDIALMRSLPNMSVFCPGDPIESRLCTLHMHKMPGPSFLRLGKGSGEPVVHPEDAPPTSVSSPITLKEGRDATILSTGNMLQNAALSSELLKEAGVDCGVISAPTIKPLDEEAILKIAEGPPLFTLEEHSRIGGLGSAVSELIAESATNARFCRIALPDKFCKEVGSQNHLREIHGLSPEKISGKILSSLNRFPSRE